MRDITLFYFSLIFTKYKIFRDLVTLQTPRNKSGCSLRNMVCLLDTVYYIRGGFVLVNNTQYERYIGFSRDFPAELGAFRYLPNNIKKLRLGYPVYDCMPSKQLNFQANPLESRTGNPV